VPAEAHVLCLVELMLQHAAQQATTRINVCWISDRLYNNPNHLLFAIF
jgi:hypothetical protein